MIPHIHTRTFGSGPRPALAIHCSLGHSGAWRAFAAPIEDLVTLTAYDLPNHGKSGEWDGQGVMHDTATDMALAAMDDIATTPLDLIGHSFGGTVALRIAIEHPQRVRSVALFEPVYFAAAMADDPTFAPRYATDTAEFDAALAAGDDEGAARAFNRAWSDGPSWDNIPAQMRAYMTDRIHFVRHSAPFVAHDSAGLLAPGRFSRAQMPVLLMRGASSPWMKAVNDAIARRLPLVQSQVCNGMGHMGPITHPTHVAALWRDFLNSI